MLPGTFSVNCVLIFILCINGFDISANPRRKSHITWHLNKNHKPIPNFGPFNNNEENFKNNNKMINQAIQAKAAAMGEEDTLTYQNNNNYLESDDNVLINDETSIVDPMRHIVLPQLEFREEPSSKRIVSPLVQSLIAPFPEEFMEPIQQSRITYNTFPREMEPLPISPLRDFYRLNNDFAHAGLFSIDIVDTPRKVIPRKQFNVVYNKIDMNNVLPYRKQTVKNRNIDINNEFVIPKEPVEKEQVPERNLNLLYRGLQGKPMKSITPPPKKLYVIIEDSPKLKRQTRRKKTRDSHRQKKAPSLLDFNAFSLAKVPKQKHKQKPSGTHDDDDKSIALDLFKKVRILCWVLTHPPNHNITTKPIRQTWGRRCNKLLFISSVEDDDPPSLKSNDESSEHLWPKVKAAFMYVYNHHRNDAEWFLRADDDTYVIMENLRYMLSDYNSRDPLYFGCRAVEGNTFDVESNYMNGGAGVILSKNAIDRLMNKGFFGAQLCRNSDDSDFNADLKLGICLHRVGVKAMDTRDAEKKARFMPLPAQDIVAPKDAITANDSYWRRTLRPPKVGLSCCSDFAISFHYVSPKDMYALEYLIYHVRPFGIKFGEAGVPGLLANNTEPRFEINAMPKIPDNPFQLKSWDENQPYSKHRKDLADDRNVLLVQRDADDRGPVQEKSIKIVWNARDTAMQDQEKVLPKKKIVKIKPVVTTPKLNIEEIHDENSVTPLNRSSNSNDEYERDNYRTGLLKKVENNSHKDKAKKLSKSFTKYKYKYNVDYNGDQENSEEKANDDRDNEKYNLEEYQQESVVENSKSNFSENTAKGEIYAEEYYKLTDLASKDIIPKSEKHKKDNNKGNAKESKRVKKILPKPKTKSKSKKKENKYKHRVLNYEYIEQESTTNTEDLTSHSTGKSILSERYFKEQLNDGVFEYSFDQKNLVVREMSEPEMSPKKVGINTTQTKNKKDLDADYNEEIIVEDKTASLDEVAWVSSNDIDNSFSKNIYSDKDTLVTDKNNEGVLKIERKDKYDELDEDSWDDTGDNVTNVDASSYDRL